MLVEIHIPEKYITFDDKNQFIQDVILWAKDNLSDKEDWKYKEHWANNLRYTIAKDESLFFNISNEEDAIALKLVWSSE